MYGFTKGVSCLNNLLSFCNKVFQQVEREENYDVIFLHFSKAFDEVLANRLLLNLLSHEAEDKVLSRVKAWLSNRKQREPISGKRSDRGCYEWCSTRFGIRFNFFLIYINGLSIGINSDVSKLLMIPGSEY